MNKDFCKLGLAVIESEAQAINALTSRIDETFSQACEQLLACKGRIIVMGMGKSGHIGNKIAATLASTGSPAFFVHPGEACHGDFGMITKDDIIIAISNSGKSQELLTLLPLIKRQAIPLVSLCGDMSSPLAQSSTVCLNTGVEFEACPLGLAPTTSTTATLVMGDALAIALLQSRGFNANDFALSHPGGSLGRKLLLRIDELCQTGDTLPLVKSNTSIRDALIEITNKKLGMTCVIDKHGKLIGIFTDGDVRRALTSDINIHTEAVDKVMTTNCRTTKLGLLAAEALTLLETNKITSLVVINDKKHPIGVLHMHHLVQAGVI